MSAAKRNGGAPILPSTGHMSKSTRRSSPGVCRSSHARSAGVLGLTHTTMIIRSRWKSDGYAEAITSGCTPMVRTCFQAAMHNRPHRHLSRRKGGPRGGICREIAPNALGYGTQRNARQEDRPGSFSGREVPSSCRRHGGERDFSRAVEHNQTLAKTAQPVAALCSRPLARTTCPFGQSIVNRYLKAHRTATSLAAKKGGVVA